MAKHRVVMPTEKALEVLRAFEDKIKSSDNLILIIAISTAVVALEEKLERENPKEKQA